MTLDDIKRALKRASVNGSLKPGEYPQMIALLERLQEPTRTMTKAAANAFGSDTIYPAVWRVMLKAAEEAK